MIWRNPWAWLGLAAIVVPVLVHLLARRRARPLPFPTLRFLDASRLMQARRDRLTDIALLAVRAGVLTAAVAALAAPWVATPGRTSNLRRHQGLARAVIVDASASMQRATPAGGTALEAARREGRRLSGDSSTSIVQESAEPGRALVAARGWLDTQPGPREVTMISDFQSGTLDPRDLAALPADIGVRLVRIDVSPAAAPLRVVSTIGTSETTAEITLAPARTDVVWTTRPRGANAADGQPILLAGDAERARVDAAAEAARELGAAVRPASHPIAIVFPGYDGRARLIEAATALTEPWMFDAVARISRDPMLSDAGLKPGATYDTAADRIDGRGRLLLFSKADAGSLASSALIASATIAGSPVTPVAELDPSTTADDVLRGWQRAPGEIATPRPSDGADESDGRWLWGLALVLLGVETWMRRTQGSSPPVEVEHARVA